MKRSDGEPLRSSTDVTYLRNLAGMAFDPDTVDGVYSSHISFLVTGYDQWRWTGLMLIETWFEEVADDPTRDMVSSYENDKEDGMLLDPFSQGRDEMEKSVLFPRYHFMRTMQVRITQCKDEWENLFFNLEKIITGAVCSLFLPSSTFMFLLLVTNTNFRCNRPGSKRHTWRRCNQLRRRLTTDIDSPTTLGRGS